MSIATGALIQKLERDLLEMSRSLTDSKTLIEQLSQRLAVIENRSKPGPKPRNG